MSTETLTKPDVDSAADFKAWETEMAVGRKKDLGAAACSGCVFMAMGCPGKKESAPNCPPEAEKIQEKEIRAALFDDRVASVSIDGRGGYTALPDKAAKLQTLLAVAPKPVVENPISVPQPALATRTSKHETKGRPKFGQGIVRTLGEFVMKLFGGDVSPRRKK